ncbi:MAG: hypothetical protein ACR2GD_04890 [Pyrinomonadaceae bacterium]
MAFAGIGGLLLLIGTIWLIVLAVQTGQTTGEKALWGIVNFICQPIGGIVFYAMKRVGLVPLILVIIGWLLAGYGYYGIAGDMMRNNPPYHP